MQRNQSAARNVQTGCGSCTTSVAGDGCKSAADPVLHSAGSSNASVTDKFYKQRFGLKDCSIKLTYIDPSLFTSMKKDQENIPTKKRRGRPTKMKNRKPEAA